MTDLHAFSDKLREARTRLARHGVPPAQREDDVSGFLEELQTAWEELNTAEEELEQQNEELVRARTATEEERRRYADLFHFAPDGYLVTDLNGTITEANRAAGALLNIRPDLLMGKPLPTFIDPAHRPAFRRELHRLPENGARADWGVRVRPRDGPPVEAAFSVAPILDLDGRTEGYRWAMRDVTARHEVEAELRHHRDTLEARVAERTADLEAAHAAKDALLASAQTAREQAEAANRAKDVFLATLSHELRTPLTALVGWIHILRQPGVDRATWMRALDVIERSSRSQVRLIEEILDVSRIIAGKLTLEPRVTEIAPLVEAAVAALRPSAEEQGLTVSVSMDPVPMAVLVDPERFQQVLWNVMSNAIKFTPSGGRIEVELVGVGTSAEIRVRDTGRGIDPEFLPQVFERFRQSESGPTRAKGGLGIGLAIAHHLVDRHGGTIRAESDGRGKGAQFVITIPLHSRAEPWPPGLERRRQPRRARAAASPVRVLVVDDDRDGRDVMATALRQVGMDVVTASSVPEAIDEFRAQRPDVVVSDIAMPDQDGCTLIRQLRALESSSFGALAVTSYVTDEVDREVRTAGFDECFMKPFSMAELATAVAALALRGKRDS